MGISISFTNDTEITYKVSINKGGMSVGESEVMDLADSRTKISIFHPEY
jgi:hypothetical protein